MAKLNSFRVDARLIEEGAWISPGEEYDDLMIKCRGYTDAYHDRRAAKLRRSAIGFGGNVDKVPAAISRAITVEALIEFVLLDVKNLADGQGNDIGIAQFRELLRDPNFPDLLIATLKSAAMVGQQRAEDIEDASKNSQPPSATPSPGVDSAIA